jgi:regulator of sigma E protease
MNLMSFVQVPTNLMAYTVLPFLFAIIVVIFIHELGHFYVGRLCGVKIETFAIGFGKEIFGFYDKHGTRWKFCWIPLGGYVKFKGDANAASLPSNDASLEPGTLASAALWKRMAIVAAGPLANFVLAIFIYTCFFTAFGVTSTTSTIGKLEPNSAAAKADLRIGDHIQKLDGTQITDFSQIIYAMRFKDGKPVELEFERSGQVMTMTITPQVMEIDDGKNGKTKVSRLGIYPSSATKTPVSIPEAVVHSVAECKKIIDLTARVIGRIFLGLESASVLSGPVGTAEAVGDVFSSFGWLGLFSLIAGLSVSIGFFNLLPIPILDGGHLVFYAFEAIFRRPASPQVQEWSMRIGLSLLLALMIFTTYSDIGKVMTRHFGG